MKKKKILIPVFISIIVVIAILYIFKNKMDPKVEDYNYFWETIEESFPYYSFLNEDNRLVSIKENYKEELEDLDYENNDEILEFYSDIARKIKNGKTIGHFNFLEKGRYLSELGLKYSMEESMKLSGKKKLKLLEGFVDTEEDAKDYFKTRYEEDKNRNELLSNKKVKDYYEFDETDEKELISLAKSYIGKLDINSYGDKNNIVLNIDISNGIYIKLKSFGFNKNEEENFREIKNFIIENSNKENLIIDIRGNDGGDSRYWIEIMKYLIRKPESVKSINMYRDSKILEKYYKIPKDDRKYIRDLEDGNIIKKKYEKDFDFIVEGEGIDISPIVEDPIFNGKIWVLVDGEVYSAAMQFMDFCNSTDYITTVGTNGGGGMNFGNCLLSLPNAGLVYKFDLSVRLNDDLQPTDIYGVPPKLYTEEDALEYVRKILEKY